MTSPDRPPSETGRGLALPGQAIEQAAAEVGSEAGKSLVRGIAKLGNAYVGKWTATKEAQAEAAKLAIETNSKIERDAALAQARRQQEVAELEHQATLHRRMERLRRELEREQLNLEAIETLALEFTEHDPSNGNPREIDEDWLFKFADLAQKVSDKHVQDFWARALSSAAMEGATKLSAAALQTLGPFDKHIAESLKEFVAVVVRLGFFPHTNPGQTEPQQIDMPTLVDLGLVQETMTSNTYDFGDFIVSANQTRNLLLPLPRAYLALTKRGEEIANAVFRSREDVPLSAADEQTYLQNILQSAVQQSGATITIVPKARRRFETCNTHNVKDKFDRRHRKDRLEVFGRRASI